MLRPRPPGGKPYRPGAGEQTLGEIGRQSREEIMPRGANLAMEPFVAEGPWQTKPSPLPLRVG